ncbi:MAG TPA: mobilization protein MobD [Campylobacteraceae bacterium]|nr:mobilization protein MobD [Campylobacteraceae bacterium]HHD84248.1 mobilization protein MobD [Campylobacteraceae bacterium]
MKTIHLIGGEKGGVGKSLFARLLSQYYIDRQEPYIGLDADRSHPTLQRYYQDTTQPIDLDHFESSDQIVEMAIEKDTNVIVDLPAQSERFLDRWLEENDILGLCQEMQIRVIYWYLVDDGNDSLQLVENFLQKYGNTIDCVVLKNLGRGSDFSAIDAVVEAAQQSGNAKIHSATLPQLHAPTMHKINKLNFSFWGAANISSGDAHLGLMERQRTKVWLRKTYAMLDAILQEA